MYQNPRNLEQAQNIGKPEHFTLMAFNKNLESLVRAGYTAHDFFDQQNIDENDPKVFFNFVMQYAPNATYELLHEMDDLSFYTREQKIPVCLTVRMDSESFSLSESTAKSVVKAINNFVYLDVSYAILLTPKNDDCTKDIKKAAKRLELITGRKPRGFLLSGPVSAKHNQDLTELDGMMNIGHTDFKNVGDMWSDSNGGWYGSLTDKIETLDGAKSLLIQNSEGAWWSPKPMHAFERLERVGSFEYNGLGGKFPEQYVAAVQAGKRFIPGEPGSVLEKNRTYTRKTDTKNTPKP